MQMRKGSKIFGINFNGHINTVEVEIIINRLDLDQLSDINWISPLQTNMKHASTS